MNSCCTLMSSRRMYFFNLGWCSCNSSLKVDVKHSRLEEDIGKIVGTFNEYEIENMTVKGKVDQTSLMVRSIMREYRRIERGLQNLRTEKRMLQKSVKGMTTRSVKYPRVLSKPADRTLISAKTQLAILRISVFRIIPAWSETEVS